MEGSGEVNGRKIENAITKIGVWSWWWEDSICEGLGTICLLWIQCVLQSIYLVLVRLALVITLGEGK